MSLAASAVIRPRKNRSVSAPLQALRRRGSSIASLKFPLPEDAFESVRLSDVQLHAHKQQIQQLIEKALDECDRAEAAGSAAYSLQWELVGAQDNVTALRHHAPASSAASDTSQYRLMGDVSGDYRDHMALHYADTSNDLYEWLQFMNQSTLDAHIIQTVESQSSSKLHQYFGVKWAAFQTSMFATKVDRCFVEYMTYCNDRRGREVGVRVTLPIRIPEIDAKMDALHVQRMRSQIVQILRPVNDKTTHMFVLTENDFVPASPPAYVKTLLALCEDSMLALDARRIRRRGLVAEKNWIPNGARISCVVCMRTFGAARARHHCRLCGDVICRKCTVVRDTAEPITHKTFKVTKTKFCVVCVVELRARDALVEAEADDSDATADAAVAAQRIAAVDLSASKVSAFVQDAYLTVEKGRGKDYVPADSVDEGSRPSGWSETESEGLNQWDFDFADSASSSLSSPQDGGDHHSFGRRLYEIAERVEDLVVDESTTTTTTSAAASTSITTTLRKSRRAGLVLFIPDDANDFIQTIDTKDMLRGTSSPGDASRSSSLTVFDDCTKQLSRNDSAKLLSATMTRLLDQNLAEQEALLRRLLMAAQGGRAPRHDASRALE